MTGKVMAREWDVIIKYIVLNVKIVFIILNLALVN